MNTPKNWLKTQYFAHRGLHDDAIPENSMAAFKNAVLHGFDIECDIRMTKDQELVVFHDATLKRMCDRDEGIYTLDAKEVIKQKLLDSNEHIPLLKDLLDTLPKTTHLLIEIKPHHRPKMMVEVFLKLIKDYSFTYAIHSFDPSILYYFKKYDPSILRGQIASTFPNKSRLKYFFLKHLAFNVFTKPDFINYRFEDLPRKKLDKLKEKGTIILSYTARSEADLAFVKKHYHNAVFENFIPKK